MRILAGVEGGEESKIVVENTLERADDAGDSVTFAVFSNPGEEQELESIKTFVADALADSAVEAEVIEIEGDPASELVSLAECEAYDQVVVGGGRLTPTGKRYLGQITEFVVLNSDITVRLER